MKKRRFYFSKLLPACIFYAFLLLSACQNMRTSDSAEDAAADSSRKENIQTENPAADAKYPETEKDTSASAEVSAYHNDGGDDNIDSITGNRTDTGSEPMTRILVQIDTEAFEIELYDHSAVRAFAKLLPLTLSMSELNGNEKFYYFDANLPVQAEAVGQIHAGDLMLYGTDCLVLFYEDFQTPYRYTKIGFMKNASGLAEALGSGAIQVTFSIPE